MKKTARERLREHAPRSHTAFSAALALPMVWGLLYGMLGPIFPDRPSLGFRGQYYWHAVLLALGALGWLGAVGCWVRAWGEPDGRLSRVIALLFLAVFAWGLASGAAAGRYW